MILGDVEDITGTIPHREPFLFLKRVICLNEGLSIEAEMVNSPSLDFYMGHFPNKPTMPGVILLEGLAQACCYLFVKSVKSPAGTSYYLGKIKIRYLKSASPNDVVLLYAKSMKIISSGGLFEVRAYTKQGDLAIGELGMICKNE